MCAPLASRRSSATIASAPVSLTGDGPAGSPIGDERARFAGHLSDHLLTQAGLTRHAVDVLNTLPSLWEAPGWRAEHAGVTDRLRIVLRSPDTADIVYERTPNGARFDISEDGPANGDALVTTDAANRLLTIWGRRSIERSLTLDTDSISPATVESILWSAAQPWPAPGQADQAAQASSTPR